MARVFFGLVLWLVSATSLFAIGFDRYHSQEEINAYLRQMANEHPELVRFHFLGYSQQGRETDYVVISKAADPDAVPAIYMNGTHHGDEKSSTESMLGLVDYVVTHATQADVAALLEGYAVYVQPLVNPDGHAMNRREDSAGRDPNRDYSFPDRGDEDSFKVPSIKLVKDLADKVRFRAAAAFHSGMEGVLWPWCWTSQRAADYDTFYTLSKTAARAMGMSRYVQSYNDYPTRGEFIDYLYMTQGTMAVTFEVSTDATPPASQLARIVQRAVLGAMTFMLSIQDLDRGLLAIERAPDKATTHVAAGLPAAAASARVE